MKREAAVGPEMSKIYYLRGYAGLTEVLIPNVQNVLSLPPEVLVLCRKKMIRKIVAYGAPVLRRAGKEVSKDTPGLQQLIADMWQTLDNTGGVGLAAPQVDQSLRLFLVDNRDATSHWRQVFINPTILEYSAATCTEEEGCLSIPRLAADVPRPDRITIRYQDEDFQVHITAFQGMDARIIQHEYDHIEGRLYLDRLPPLGRMLLKHKLLAVSKGKVRPAYPMQFTLRS